MILKTKNFLFKFSFNIIKRPTTEVMGYMNRTTDGLYCVFLDYDYFKLRWVEDELERLSATYDIDHFFIFRSSEKGFHAVSLCKLRASEYTRLLMDSSADPAFKNVPRFNTFRSWVLRTGKKANKDRPTYVKTLYFPNVKKNYEKSRAHLMYLKIMNMIPENTTFRNLDKNKDIELIKYKTDSEIIF